MTNDRGRGATPFRINFLPEMPQSEAVLLANIAANNQPLVEYGVVKKEPLAIVGAAPSLRREIAALKAWRGPVWSINRAGDYLVEHGVRSTLVSVDANDFAGAFADPLAVDDAIFASWCDPAVVSRYPARIFHMFPAVPDGLVGATTTAGTMAALAVKCGFSDVTWFGCEGSFAENTHVGYDEPRAEQLIVRADGADFRTAPDMLLQCEEIAQFLKAFPEVFKERSGGLLRAMVRDDLWSVVAVSDDLADHLDALGGGFCSAPYTPSLAERPLSKV